MQLGIDALLKQGSGDVFDLLIKLLATLFAPLPEIDFVAGRGGLGQLGEAILEHDAKVATDAGNAKENVKTFASFASLR